MQCRRSKLEFSDAILVSLLSCLFLQLLPALSADKTERELILDAAKTSQIKGDLYNTAYLYQKAAVKNPNDLTVMQEYLRACEDLVASNSYNPMHHLMMGKAFQLSGNYRAASMEYAKVIGLSPRGKHPEAEQLRNVVTDLQNFEAAKRDINEPFVQYAKALLQRDWKPPKHYDPLITKIDITLDSSGKISKQSLTYSSKNPTQDTSCLETLSRVSFGTLPGGAKNMIMHLCFISDRELALVQIDAPRKSIPYQCMHSYTPPHFPTFPRQMSITSGASSEYDPLRKNSNAIPETTKIVPPAAPAVVLRASYHVAYDDITDSKKHYVRFMTDLKRRIRRAWTVQRLPASVEVSFKVRTDGSIASLKIESSSGN